MSSIFDYQLACLTRDADSEAIGLRVEDPRMMYMACHAGHLSIIDKYIEQGMTPSLYIVAQQGHYNIMKKLLERGFRCNHAATVAHNNGHDHIVDLLAEYDLYPSIHPVFTNQPIDDEDIVFEACKSGDVETVSRYSHVELCSAHLHMAIRSGSESLVQYLLHGEISTTIEDAVHYLFISNQDHLLSLLLKTL